MCKTAQYCCLKNPESDKGDIYQPHPSFQLRDNNTEGEVADQRSRITYQAPRHVCRSQQEPSVCAAIMVLQCVSGTSLDSKAVIPAVCVKLKRRRAKWLKCL
ncbi:hypothetical protein GOODEAATRI_031604 [Goodea atripinnis]|uniref:Uncharacterized protein n=1 Tax=Goodea atripinnis TaxID=208336 RepID=A0ABV0N934_9TELE